MKANKLILSGREQKNPFGDWVKLYDWFVCLLGKSLESWAAEIERSGLSSRFISLFTTFLQQEKRFIVKLCFCRLTCLECQKKNHGDPKPVFPLGHPHTSSETNYFQRPTSCKDRSTKNNQVLQYTVANCWCPNSIQQERQRVKRDTNLATEKHLFLEFWLDPLKTLKLVRKKVCPYTQALFSSLKEKPPSTSTKKQTKQMLFYVGIHSYISTTFLYFFVIKLIKANKDARCNVNCDYRLWFTLQFQIFTHPYIFHFGPPPIISTVTFFVVLPAYDMMICKMTSLFPFCWPFI